MKPVFKDHFSGHSDIYAQYRPHYPAELFDYLASLTKRRETVWDCATGNGQAAVMLAKYFEKVIATDASESQLRHAPRKDNVYYDVCPAEKTNIESGTVDLVTVAAAIHWFKFDSFYEEVRRVSRHNGILAVWTYDMVQIEKKIDTVIWNFYKNIVGPFWPEGRVYVEEKYQTIPFPFQEFAAPHFQIESRWSLDQLIGYLRTWSSVQRYIQINSKDPIELIQNDLERLWEKDRERLIVWPLFTRIGIIEK